MSVGALEQYGPHLPVRVDAAINAGIVARSMGLMPPDLPVRALPAPPIGKSNEHTAYPGTKSPPFEVPVKVWFQAAKSAWRAGVRKFTV